MTLFEIVTILVVLAALFAWINKRFIGLPTTIGVMIVSLVGSIALLMVGWFVPSVVDFGERLLEETHFEDTLLHGMLAFLLFAGALHTDLGDLAKRWATISLLAVVGTLVSSFLVGGATYVLLHAFGFTTPWIFCLLFGTLISPTDPIAVLGIMKSAEAPPLMKTVITGESLFNDGVGVVMFLVVLGIAAPTGHHDTGMGSALLLFFKEVLGGLALGLAAGYLTFLMMRRVNDYHVEILLTLGLAMGAFALAEALHLSAPLAIVAAGLLIGNHGRMLAVSDTTREHLDTFWELIDEILNAVLFLLIGLELLIIKFEVSFVVVALVSIFIVLGARLLVVVGVLSATGMMKRFPRGTTAVLTWGGLRGGISVALALSVPKLMTDGTTNPHRELLLVMTYVVVVFSILVQGLSLGTVIRWVVKKTDDPHKNESTPTNSV